MPWTNPITRYCTALIADGAGARTVRLRRYYVTRFSLHVNTDPWSVRIDDVRDWLGSYPEWSPSTRKSARDSIVSFYRWAWTTDRIDRDPTRGLKPIRVPRKSQPVADDRTISAALASASHREAVMLLLARDAGLRVNEIATLRYEDRHGSDLLVRGKGGKVRIVPLTPRLQALLLGAAEGYVFPGKVDGHVSAGWVGKLLKRQLSRYTAHAVRRGFASKTHRACKDARIVQELLGHASLSTTQLYLEVDLEIMRAAVIEASLPVAA